MPEAEEAHVRNGENTCDKSNTRVLAMLSPRTTLESRLISLIVLLANKFSLHDLPLRGDEILTHPVRCYQHVYLKVPEPLPRL